MILNLTKKRVLAKNFEKKEGFGKIKGMLGRKTPKTLYFKTRFGIHTFFLKFSIDLVVLDKNKKIVFLKRNIKPNKIVVWNPRFNKVIELPAGFLFRSKTKKGDILTFKG